MNQVLYNNLLKNGYLEINTLDNIHQWSDLAMKLPPILRYIIGEALHNKMSEENKRLYKIDLANHGFDENGFVFED